LGTAFRPPEFSLHEDRATAPLHLLLALGCGAAALGARRARAKRETAIFAALLFASGATYLALLKWQPWPSKHLPWLVCSAPLVAVVLERWRPWIAGVAALTLAAAATPYLVMNQTRPLLGERSIFRTPRLEQYFATAPYLLPPYVGLARYAIAHRCADVGLRWSKDTPEYQLWVLLAAGGRPFRLEHVEVRNRSAAAADGAPGYASFRPCVTFSALEGVRRFEAAAADGSEAIIFSQDPL
jgi:hypothetical protein